jgi:hypothetical protein
MRLERVRSSAPRFVSLTTCCADPKVNKTFVFLEGARNCKDFSGTDLTVAGSAGSSSSDDYFRFFNP